MYMGNDMEISITLHKCVYSMDIIKIHMFRTSVIYVVYMNCIIKLFKTNILGFL